MIDFIICEDLPYVRDLYKKLLNKITMPFDFNYHIYEFEKYDIRLKNIINTPSNLKIYLLDLELPGKLGIDIAREIRKVDWDSIIIIMSSHEELEFKILKEKLLIYDFISKFDDYDIKLTDDLKTILKRKKCSKTLNFKSNKELHQEKLENIYYVYKDNVENKVGIVTNDNLYLVRDSLTNISKNLDERFCQTHRACYVNVEKINSVDFQNNIIVFENDKKSDYLSRNYKKDLRDRL